MPAIVVFIAPSKLEVYSVQGVKGSNLQPKLNMLKTWIRDFQARWD